MVYMHIRIPLVVYQCIHTDGLYYVCVYTYIQRERETDRQIDR